MLSPALILACTSVDVFVPGITISGSGGRNRTVSVKLHTSHSQKQGMHHRTPLLAVQLSLLCAVLEASPGFISEQHKTPMKQKPPCSGTASPPSQQGQLAMVWQALSQGVHSQQPTEPSPLANLQGKSSGYRGTTPMQTGSISGSDARLPAARVGINNSPCSSIHHGHHNSTHCEHQQLTCGGDNLLHKDTSSL